jgi:hypothetical protein
MRADEAIKNLTYLKRYEYPREGMPNHEAIQLGIEALKWYKRWRSARHAAADYLLPGETEK